LGKTALLNQTDRCGCIRTVPQHRFTDCLILVGSITNLGLALVVKMGKTGFPRIVFLIFLSLTGNYAKDILRSVYQKIAGT
jgi:hypothetical protein